MGTVSVPGLQLHNMVVSTREMASSSAIHLNVPDTPLRNNLSMECKFPMTALLNFDTARTTATGDGDGCSE